MQFNHSQILFLSNKIRLIYTPEDKSASTFYQLARQPHHIRLGIN